MKNRTKGILWIVVPILSLMVILSAYAITSFVVSTLQDTSVTTESSRITVVEEKVVGDQVGLDVVADQTTSPMGENDLRHVIGALINVALGFLGVIAVILIFVGIGMGIHYLTKGDGITLPHLVKHYGGFWRRYGAYLIDGVIIYVGYALVGGVFMAIFESVGEYGGILFFVMYALVMIGTWLYFILFESSNMQATPGKMALGMKVTDLHGKRLSFGRATGRFFAKIVSGITLYIGYFMIGWTEKKQGLHDIIAGTLVVKE